MKKFWESAIICLQNYGWYLLITLVIGIVLGIVLGVIFTKTKLGIYWRKQKRRLENLENWVMGVSFLIAVICTYRAISGKAAEIDSQYLSIYSSMIFAWILTKKTASKDFKRSQHKIAKSTYRHIEDAETAVLIAKNRLMNNGERELNDSDVVGLIDDLQFILTCIRSNKKDWSDMLKKSYRNKIDAEENPEDILEREYYNKLAPESILKTFGEDIRAVSGSNS